MATNLLGAERHQATGDARDYLIRMLDVYRNRRNAENRETSHAELADELLMSPARHRLSRVWIGCEERRLRRHEGGFESGCVSPARSCPRTPSAWSLRRMRPERQSRTRGTRAMPAGHDCGGANARPLGSGARARIRRAGDALVGIGTEARVRPWSVRNRNAQAVSRSNRRRRSRSRSPCADRESRARRCLPSAESRVPRQPES